MEAASFSSRPVQEEPVGGATAGVPAIANPAPLGLAGFALTTFVLSMINTGLVSQAALPVVFGLALAYGGIAQFMAGMWDFRTGNTFGATAFGSFGAFWLSYWALVTFFLKDIPAADAGHAVGLYLWAWGLFTFMMFIAALRTTVAVATVLFLLGITFIVLGIGNSGGHTGIIKLGGWVGLVTALTAWYTAIGTVINSTFGRDIAPMGPLTH